MNKLPVRRIDIQRMVPAEQAILNAIYEVEKLPGSPQQTDVVCKLVEAGRMLADIVDGVEAEKPHVPTTGGLPPFPTGVVGMPLDPNAWVGQPMLSGSTTNRTEFSGSDGKTYRAAEDPKRPINWPFDGAPK